MTQNAFFAKLIEPAARSLLGEPNEALSSRTQLRYGSHGSLVIEIAGQKAGTYFDHERNEGGGTLDFVARETGHKNGDAVAWLREKGFIVAEEPKAQRRVVATYDYKDAAGVLLFQVVRFVPKDFRQRRPDGNGGWSWKLGEIERVPYRLPELMRAAPHATVFIAEGEKDCEALAERGLVATCNPGGAGKWLTSYSPHLSSTLRIFGLWAGGQRIAQKMSSAAMNLSARSIESLVGPSGPDATHRSFQSDQ